ncbi:hypothetical protein [Streptosporangium carneum]|uniref:Uncharacterized protein n=1 Tax=Streptosporangium carneum TaxID=47481 RepID=A0A9W6HVD4_9ACTN|nr:hypothetical protein [Streptosporangium carneum]GLK06992.1 hypothetical protein GCM10017600_03970 [Streptosporangium carneum]
MLPRKPLGFLIFAGLAVAAAAFVWFGLPHDREVKSLWLFLVKLLPFVFATEAVARLDVEWAKRIRLVLWTVPVAFLVYFLYFVPKIFFFGGVETGTRESFYALYYHVLTLTPLIILSLTLANRLGGGTAATTRRLAYGMLLLMLSGLEDFAFLTVNDHTDPAYATIPDVWDWASHMTVFLGHPPTRNEAYAFIIVHVLLALGVFFSPQRWWDSLAARTTRPRSAQPESV